MRSQRFTLNSYATALITLLVGVVLSLELGDWGWFSRCGSLVVVNGIVLTSHQIIQHMHQLDRQRHGMEVRRDWAALEKRHFIRDDNTRQWRSEKQGLYLLVAGTLVWGFGDLLNLL